MAISGISHLGLTVSDLAASREWYATVLDWTCLMEGGTDSTRFAYGQLPDGTTLVLRQHDSPTADRFDERRPGLDHLALAGRRSDLDSVVERLEQCGTRYTPVQETEHAFVLNFRDPDDVALEITAPLTS